VARWLLESIAAGVKGGDISVSCAARAFGLSRSQIYRQIQAEERPGEDGVRFTVRERDIAFQVAAVLMAGMSKKKKRTMATHDAIQELVILGAITKGEMSVSRANRLMKHLGISARYMRRPGPCVSLQALGPNHLHEADFTQAAFVYLDNLTVRWQKELTKKTPRQPIQLGIVTDHYSRAILCARAYPSRAENAADTLRLLYDAWNPKLGTSGLPHGVPWLLYTDQGPGFTAGSTHALCKALYCDISHHEPGRSQATGLAENTIKRLTTFQHILKSRLCRGVSIDIERLNGMMQEWVIDQNALPHPEFTGTTRAQVWQQIQDDDIRRCPPWDVFVKLSAYREHHRTVERYGTVLFDKLRYYVGTDYVGHKVWAYQGPNNGIYVEIPGKGVVGPIRSGMPRTAIGTYAHIPLTNWEKNLNEVREVRGKLGYTPDDVDYHRMSDEVFPPREGRPIVDDKGESERFYTSVFEAKSALADSVDLGSLTEEIMEEIERTLEDRADPAGCIPTTVVDEIARLVAEVH